MHMMATSPLLRRRLQGLAAPLAALLAVGLLALPVAAQDATGHERLVDLTFPLSGDNYYSDTFDAPRSGSRTHRATDLMADKLVPVHAAVGGEVCYLKGDGDSNIELSGYMLEICGDDGLEYSYIHLNNDNPGTDDGMGGNEWAFAPGIEEGVRVERGQWIGYVGDSGNAENTGSHLHFSIKDDNQSEESGYVNPYRSLLAAQDRGDYPDAPGTGGGSDGPVEEPSDQPTDAPDEQPAEEPDDQTDDEPAEDRVLSIARLAGDNRVATSVALSEAEWPDDARAVVIVPAGSHAEALVAAPLAGLIDSPVLLSGPEGLDDIVIDEITRLDPLSAYVVGDEDQLSAQVMDDLDEIGIRFRARLEGDDRYDLSAVVAEDIASYQDPARIGRVYLALGDAEDASRAWPDALSASALAAHDHAPVLLTEGDSLPDAVADLLTEYRPDEVIVIGGTAAIRDSVAEEAAELADAELVRISGDTRYATSAAVADVARESGLDDADVWVATGLDFPDALAAGPAAARSGSPLVLIDGRNPGGAPVTTDWLGRHAEGLKVVGGTAVITDDVVDSLSR
jgi:putative cell wall-binding protein